jgi:CheY-like chemotaxis protein
MQTILIVDDNARALEWAMVALKALDCDVINAGGGRSALMKIRSQMPDLTLIDLHMPDMDGFAVIHELRTDPATAGLCIVAFTASAMRGDREMALNAGFAEFISKPIGLCDFRQQVTKLLKVTNCVMRRVHSI